MHSWGPSHSVRIPPFLLFLLLSLPPLLFVCLSDGGMRRCVRMATFFQCSAEGEMRTVQTGTNYSVSAGSTLILIHLMTPWWDTMREREKYVLHKSGQNNLETVFVGILVEKDVFTFFCDKTAAPCVFILSYSSYGWIYSGWKPNNIYNAEISINLSVLHWPYSCDQWIDAL